MLTALTCNTASPDDLTQVRAGVVEWLVDDDSRKLEADIEDVNVRMFDAILGKSHHVAAFFLSKSSMHSATPALVFLEVVLCYMMTKMKLVTGRVTIYTFIFVECLCVPEQVFEYSF